jgi:Protein of unknown function (DUF3160)
VNAKGWIVAALAAALVSTALVVVLIVTDTLGGGDQTAASTTAPPPTEPAGGDVALPIAAFADVQPVPLRGDDPAYAGPAGPTSLDGVLLTEIAKQLVADRALAAKLTRSGFVATPSLGGSRLFHEPYTAAEYNHTPVFVTTDAAYHMVHLAFSKVLRETEQRALLPAVESMVVDLEGAAAAQRRDLAGTPLANLADRVEQTMEAGADLAGADVGPIGPLAAKEVAMARAAAEIAASPTTSFGPCNPLRSPKGCVNYTAFRPRGHYTRNDDLKRYFRVMSLLGNLSFFIDQPDSLRMGALVARLMTDPALADRWTSVYEPTAFLVGAADDYTPAEVARAADAAVPGWRDDPAALASEAATTALAAELESRRRVRIDPEAAGMRVMGTRFTIDSYVLDQLTFPQVGTDSRRRAKPSALDVAAAMGSPLARALQEKAGQFEFLNYGKQLDALTSLFAERPMERWAATVYDAWLYALQPKLAPKGAAFPGFMRNDAWTAKDLQTALGSYTELKHDTVLYAKQAIVAEGEGPPAPPAPPRHWVEPDPVAFARLGVVVNLLSDGLGDRKLLAADERVLLADVADVLVRLGRLAEDELAGRPITADDNAWLEGFGARLEALWVRSSDIDPATGQPGTSDQDAALVSDIFTASRSGALEVATGRIDDIWVLVPNDDGRFQLAWGGVYSFYEFYQPIDRRLTDEEWRAMLDAGTAPARPAWQEVFRAPVP